MILSCNALKIKNNIIHLHPQNKSLMIIVTNYQTKLYN